MDVVFSYKSEFFNLCNLCLFIFLILTHFVLFTCLLLDVGGISLLPAPRLASDNANTKLQFLYMFYSIVYVKQSVE